MVILGGVFVPGWWVVLQFGSLAVLVCLCFFLMKRHRELCIIAWCAFWVSLVADVVPGYV
jgi:hypothetical protein